jgi:nucleotide-binding universal stress UspA family protein
LFKHILVPTDGSPLSRRAAKVAGRLAKAHKAKITVLHVIPPFFYPPYMEGAYLAPELVSAPAYKRQAEKEARAMIDAAAKAAGTKVEGVTVMAEPPWKSIVALARRRGCDLVVMASHGRRGLESLLLGSETTKVLTHSKVPVLVCR